MPDGQKLFGEVTLDSLKSKAVLATDGNGVIIDGTAGAGALFLKLDQTTPQTVTNGPLQTSYSVAAVTDQFYSSLHSEITNTGSSSNTTGHLVGVWGHATDTVAGRHFLIGAEGKVTGLGGIDQAVPYYGLAGFARWYGSGTPNAGTFISGAYIKMEEAESEGGAAKHNINHYGFYVDNGVGGNIAFGFYIAPLTQGTLNIGGAIGAASTYTLWLGANTDSTAAAGGITFGVSGDTNLYRSAANSLKTDDTFYAEDLYLNDDATILGDATWLSDTGKAIFGAGSDASITYDGTNLLINPQVVGTGATLFTGNVGIGTTTPDWKLDVEGSDSSTGATAISGRIINTNNTGNGFAQFITTSDTTIMKMVADRGGASGYIANTAGGYFGTQSAHGFGLLTTNAIRMYIDSAGKVGIGTTAPSATNSGLDIASGGISLVFGADSGASTRTNSTTKLGRFGSYHYTNTEEPVGMLVANNTSTDNELIIGGGSGLLNTATHIRFQTAANTTTTTGTERMRITSAGNVGIGTATPAVNLEVYSATAASQIYVTGSGYQGIFTAKSNLNATNGALLQLLKSRGSTASPTAVQNGDTLGAILGYGYSATGSGYKEASSIFFEVDGTPDGSATDMPGRIVFKTTPDGSSTGNERMRITSAGNVGIGTTAPTSLLHVLPSSTDPATIMRGGYIQATKTAATNDANQNGGLYVTLSTLGAGNYTAENSAITGTYYFAGTGTLASQNALYYVIGTTGDNTGTVTERNGVLIQNYSTSTKACTTSNGIRIKNMAAYNAPTYTAGVRIDESTTAVGTSKYGVYIGNQSGATNNYAIYTGTGKVSLGDSVTLPSDFSTGSAGSLSFGAAQDAEMGYDGTDLIVNPRLVGTGNLKLSAGSVNSFVGYQVQGTAGLGTTATPLVITTAALTAGGAQGSMTFIGGILTAQTQST